MACCSDVTGRMMGALLRIFHLSVAARGLAMWRGSNWKGLKVRGAWRFTYGLHGTALWPGRSKGESGSYWVRERQWPHLTGFSNHCNLSSAIRSASMKVMTVVAGLSVNQERLKRGGFSG